MAYSTDDLLPYVAARVAPDPNTGCWMWTGYKRGGSREFGHYGGLSVGGKTYYAHRYIYEQLVGPIPTGLVIDHLCRTPLCVNPGHLEPVTERENLLRGTGMSAVNAARTHCAQGHEYTPENTVWRKGKGRWCRECNRIYSRNWYVRKRAESAT